MTRFLSLTAVAGLVLLVAAGGAAAGDQQQAKKQKKKAADTAVTAVVGTITKVSDDGKTFTITPVGGTKKQPATTTEFKVTDKTNIEYVAFLAKEDQKLAEGYFAIVAFDAKDKDVATVVKVAKTAGPTKKKKKTGQ